jgi:hypothetical protein
MSLVARLLNPRVRRVLLWVLHALVVLLVVVALWYVNDRYKLGETLLSPFPQLHAVWLPLLFLLLYAGGWFAWWFFRLIADGPRGHFPDLDAAWGEVRGKLSAAGVDVNATPVFLVLGRPKTDAADFFAATAEPFAVRYDAGALAVYATREAVYLVASGASVLSKFAGLGDAVTPAAEPQPVPLLTADLPTNPEDLLAALMPQPQAVTRTSPDAADWLPRPAAPVRTELSAEQMKTERDRLVYVCKLLVAARRPLCPANGVIWLLPFRGTDGMVLADATAAACRADLDALETGLQLDVPMTAVFTDAQELQGFRELIGGLPAGVRTERLFGRSFPLVPNVPADARHGMVLSGLEWVAGRLVPALLYQRFGTAPTAEEAARLWRLLDDLFARRDAVARVVSQGLLARPHRPAMLSGVYFAGTGPDAADRAFAAGVLAELRLSQNLVAWTEAAAADERDCRRTAVVGYVAIVLAAVALGVFAWWTWNM